MLVFATNTILNQLQHSITCSFAQKLGQLYSELNRISLLEYKFTLHKQVVIDSKFVGLLVCNRKEFYYFYPEHTNSLTTAFHISSIRITLI